MNILIIDDEEVLQDILTALIRKEGHHPIACRTGTEGLDVLEKEEIDLVLARPHVARHARARGVAPESGSVTQIRW